MKSILIALAVFILYAIFNSVYAHHSFAIYDLENKTEIKGVLTDVSIRSPHIIFSVEVTDANGQKTEWRIESMTPNRWRTFDFPEADAIAEIGEKISILGWKARNGNPEMVLGSIITDDGEVEIRDEIRQGRGGGMSGMTRAQQG
ncbi:MAG: hypothetical protein KTR16_14695 [Acidiferrobacterales bacterium]|nr:hypothetical protein [Acidiferrobacterales bacterium]